MRPIRTPGRAGVWGWLWLAAALGACGGSETGPNPPPPPPPPTPVVRAILPSSAAAGTTSDYRILGTGFENGVSIKFSRTGVETGWTATTISVTAAEVRVSVTIAAQTPEAAFSVLANNPSGQKGTGTELLLVEDVPAVELPTPGLRGVVTVLLPSGVAYGVGSGGCSSEDVAHWSKCQCARLTDGLSSSY